MNTIIENITLSLALLIGIAGMAAGVAAIGAWRMEDDKRARTDSPQED